MPKNSENLFSPEKVCGILLNYGLISHEQAQEIFKKKEGIKTKLEKLRAMRHASGSTRSRIINPITIVDVITSLELERPDDASKILDEELIFQALAKAWKIPYKKIDPLKLDLNLVTSTIPHTFAMKHLVLPIAINNGDLTVATPNPFNVEVMEDIAQVSQLKVKPVVSTKTDVIKLINEFLEDLRDVRSYRYWTNNSLEVVNVSEIDNLIKKWRGVSNAE